MAARMKATGILSANDTDLEYTRGQTDQNIPVIGTTTPLMDLENSNTQTEKSMKATGNRTKLKGTVNTEAVREWCTKVTGRTTCNTVMELKFGMISPVTKASTKKVKKKAKEHCGLKTVHCTRCAYKGTFKNNLIEGRGIYRWNNGKVYDGEWLENQMSGFGKMTWNDGRVFEGEFANDKRNGKGKMTFTDGRVIEGKWKNGKYVRNKDQVVKGADDSGDEKS